MRVTLEDVSIRVGSRVLVEEFTHTFDSGVVTAIMGPSGAGKSTLLAVIAGVRDAAGGTVGFDAPDVRIAFMTQASTLLMERTSVDNVALGALSRGEPMMSARSMAVRLLHEVGLARVLRSRAHQLSGGERQRVMIARAMAAHAQVLLADEPTASLDLASRDVICDALRAAADGGAAVIVATHDVYVARAADLVLSPWQSA